MSGTSSVAKSVVPPIASKPSGAAVESPAVAPSFCSVEVRADGTGLAHVVIPADIMVRIQRRAGKQDLGDYLWANLFRAALNSHVY